MEVKVIEKGEQLEQLTPFHVDNLLWGTEKSPKTYGYIGFVEGDGFYLKMICEENNPLRNYTKDRDPVCNDSAMEAFFLIPTENEKQIYVNFEVNANGAMLAQYGEGRANREFLDDSMYEAIPRCARIEEDFWTVELKISLELLEKIYGPVHLEKGSVFYCNFYKISETKEIEHYAAYHPVGTETPDFHRPDYFEEAIII